MTGAVETRKPFNYRAFWALLAAVTVIGLPWTGIENHLHQFEPMTTARHAWMAAHNLLAALFAVAAAAHLVLNWRALVRHARGLAGRVVPLSREVLLALAITAALLTLFVGHAFALPDRTDLDPAHRDPTPALHHR